MKLPKTLLIALTAGSTPLHNANALNQASPPKADHKLNHFAAESVLPRISTLAAPDPTLRAANLPPKRLMLDAPSDEAAAQSVETFSNLKQSYEQHTKYRDYKFSPKILKQPKRQYARVKRLQHGIRQFNTTGAIDQMMEKPITWLNREAYSNLKHRQGNLFTRKLKWINAGTKKISAPKSPLFSPLHVNGKQTLSATPHQAKQLVQLLSQMQPTKKDLGLAKRGNQKEQSFDLLSLVIKQGTSPKALEDMMTQETGDLGWALFKNLIRYTKGGDPLKNPNFLKHNGVALKMTVWRDHYINAVIHKLDLPACLNHELETAPLDSQATLKAMNITIQQKLNTLSEAGIIGPHLYQIPKFATTLNNRVFNTVALARHQTDTTSAQTVSTRKVEKLIHKYFNFRAMPSRAQQVANAIDNGFVDVRPLSRKAFKQMCIDSFGYDRSPRTLGLARGAQIFVKGSQWRGLSSKPRLTYEELAVALHEGVHAVDYLEDPEGFQMDDPLVKYQKEKRAFHAENQFLRTLSKRVPLIEPRFTKTADIGDFVKSRYKGADYSLRSAKAQPPNKTRPFEQKDV